MSLKKLLTMNGVALFAEEEYKECSNALCK